MRKLVILLAVTMMLLGCWAGIAGASTRYERIQFMQQQIEEMESASVKSNVYIDSSWIDLSNVSSTGLIVQSTYRGGNPAPEASSFTIAPRSFDSAVDKITRYVLGNVANVYRQSPLDTEITMITHERTSIPVYVYGPHKTQALDEIALGLPDCFSISYNTSSGSSVPTKPIEMPVAEATLNAIFAVGGKTVTLSSSDAPGAPTVIEMDVAPYIKDDRTYTPVRYLAYALGVSEEGIKWDQETQTVTLTKDDTTIKLSIGSTALTKNTEIVIMDVAPELVDPGRTMLPARWVSEALGATVTWDETTQQVTIEIPSSSDQEQGQ